MYMMDACLKKCTVVLSIRKIRVSQVQNVHAHAKIVDVLLTSETVVDVLLTSTVDVSCGRAADVSCLHAADDTCACVQSTSSVP